MFEILGQFYHIFFMKILDKKSIHLLEKKKCLKCITFDYFLVEKKVPYL